MELDNYSNKAKKVKIILWSFLAFGMLILTTIVFLDLLRGFLSGNYNMKTMKVFFIVLDLIFLCLVAIIEKGSFPVRYLILLGLITSVFNYILLEKTGIADIMFIIVFLFLYQGIKIINDKYKLKK